MLLNLRLEIWGFLLEMNKSYLLWGKIGGDGIGKGVTELPKI